MEAVRMTKTPLDLVKWYYRSLVPGERQNLMEILDPQFILELQEGFPGARPCYVGLQSYLEDFLELIYGSIDLEFIPEEFLESGNRVVATGRMKGRGIRSGAPFDVGFVHLWRANDRQLVWARFFVDTAILRDVIATVPSSTSPQSP
jgi:ketosteroid isomerase-like protein